MDPTRVDRLQYLFKTFLSRPLKTTSTLQKKKVFSGLADPHHSVLRLLLLLSNSPTGTSLFQAEDALRPEECRPFPDREEYYRAKEAEETKRLREEWTVEDDRVQKLRDEWQAEL
jgi:hypothetical protein